jgi:hypothetical protein
MHMQGEEGAAGLTTVSNATFRGSTSFVGNKWALLKAGECSSGDVSSGSSSDVGSSSSSSDVSSSSS